MIELKQSNGLNSIEERDFILEMLNNETFSTEKETYKMRKDEEKACNDRNSGQSSPNISIIQSIDGLMLDIDNWSPFDPSKVELKPSSKGQRNSKTLHSINTKKKRGKMIAFMKGKGAKKSRREIGFDEEKDDDEKIVQALKIVQSISSEEIYHKKKKNRRRTAVIKVKREDFERYKRNEKNAQSSNSSVDSNATTDKYAVLPEFRDANTYMLYDDLQETLTISVDSVSTEMLFQRYFNSFESQTTMEEQKIEESQKDSFSEDSSLVSVTMHSKTATMEEEKNEETPKNMSCEDRSLVSVTKQSMCPYFLCCGYFESNNSEDDENISIKEMKEKENDSSQEIDSKNHELSSSLNKLRNSFSDSYVDSGDGSSLLSCLTEDK